MAFSHYPSPQGLYDSRFEHDACGIGFVVSIKGKRTHKTLKQALEVLVNLSHRGAVGSEADMGDGAGVLLQIPHKFFKEECPGLGISLPPAGNYGVGMLFFSRNSRECSAQKERLEGIILEEGQSLLGWRRVPVDDSILGEPARASRPALFQVFIRPCPELPDTLAFERKLYVIRKRAEKELRHAGPEASDFYAASLSARTIVYKGLLTPEQLPAFFPDLRDPRTKTALALVHSRYSTNTFPSWERAHPYRYLIHNGEINTLRGNINWMRAREAMFAPSLFGEDLKKVLPVISPDGSDSAMFDEALEFLTLTGRTLPHALMMMIPEPWSRHDGMDPARKAFYEYHSCLLEPWDGPAAMAFSDGEMVGAVLDRNGLRPSRYYVTEDETVILASEVGVLDIPPERVVCKERLHPGKMLLIDTAAGRIITDEELKGRISRQHPYGDWLKEHLKPLEQLPPAPAANPATPAPAAPAAPGLQGLEAGRCLEAFGYTYEDLRFTLLPMARDGQEPVGAMGDDTPLAVLSRKPQLLFNYFKQLFAQVTNPPIDAIWEEIVMGTETYIGPEGDLLNPRPESCRQIKLTTPILTNGELEKLRRIREPGFQALTLPLLFDASGGGPALERALEGLFWAADAAVARGVNILILSDKGLSPDQAPIPSLLAVSGLHHHLIRQGTRTRVSLVLEAGDAREVHHFALLLGYGASAVNPYLALAALQTLAGQGLLESGDAREYEGNYVSAVTKGIIKVISKMGISTLQSYQGAQIFEAIGLDKGLVDRYFTWTPSRLGGIGLDVVADEVIRRHSPAFRKREEDLGVLESGGVLQWRRDGEAHLYNPKTIPLLQEACRTGDYSLFQEYSALITEDEQHRSTLRSLLDFRCLDRPLPLEEVEPVEAILQRFKTGAMSYGSISREAHECLAAAMNRIGGRSNTGEGGEDPCRFSPDDGGESLCSAIKQVASGRFGVTSQYLVSAREIQIKMAQGAKPGEGGQLPGKKVYPWIAQTRYSTPGVGLISPPPHHDIYSIEDLAQLIHDLKNANPRARISVKLVSEAGVGTIAAGVAKGRADGVLISGFDGGTGAAPRTSIRHAGLPWELGLAETHQTLVLNNLRSRIVVETDGKLMTGRDVAVAALLGAEEFGFATAPLVAMGCVMMRVCHMDTCPVGIATQNPKLRRKFTGEPGHVVNFMTFIARELREIMARLGFRTVQEMVGRVDRLKPSQNAGEGKASGLDLSPLLHQPRAGTGTGCHCSVSQDHRLEPSLDYRALMDLCRPALERQVEVRARLPITNTDRVTGTLLGSEVTRRFGEGGLPEDTIRLKFTGSAGQSFAAFLPPGMTLSLEGDANDYVGKGLSGGKVALFPSQKSSFAPEANVIIGNVAFYGATGGEAYIRGMAGERFCVRNSGAHAVVEGVGDHGCEYMTGGRVVILGPVGRNFAAGMSGGVAYVLDAAGDFRCNPKMVDLMDLADEKEEKEVRAMIERHIYYTGSRLAWNILLRWEEMLPKFVKVMPRDYRRMLEAMEAARGRGLRGEEAVLAAFLENQGGQDSPKEQGGIQRI